MTENKKETMPVVDLSEETDRQIVVARGTADVYQGHPTTILMPDGKTMFCTWTYDHGGPCGPVKRSDDGGLTWSELLEVPENWSKVRNCPSIYRLTDPSGKERLFVFAAKRTDDPVMQQAVSEDAGKTWSEFRSIGFDCVMAFTAVVPLKDGRYVGLFHRREGGDRKSPITVWQATSEDGGLTWGEERMVGAYEGRDPCEPCVVRSPDGGQLLCLMRENLRRGNSLKMTSDDEAETWSELTETSWGLSGDRHQAKYAPDGRLVAVFRDMAPHSETAGCFFGWVGTYENAVNGIEGQYRIKLLHQYYDSEQGFGRCDCGYPGLELLPDGTFVATTYVKYRPGAEKNSVVSVRFKLSETDELLQEG